MSVLDDLAASYVATTHADTAGPPVTKDMPDPPGAVAPGWFLGISALVNGYSGVFGSAYTEVDSPYTVVHTYPDPNGHATAGVWQLHNDTTPPDITVRASNFPQEATSVRSCGVWLSTPEAGPIQDVWAVGGPPPLLPSDPAPGSLLICIGARYGGFTAGAAGPGWTLIGQTLQDGTYCIGVLARIVQAGETAVSIRTETPSGNIVWVTEWLGDSPNAEFVADRTSVLIGDTVNFTDQSHDNGAITSWAWTFGDGGTSTAQNPSHAYDAPGVYTVSLTITAADGSDSETKVDYITVTDSLGFEIFTINPPGTSYSGVGFLKDAIDKTIRPVLDEAGSGSFRLNRNSPEATSEALTLGNFVRVTIPEIDAEPIFAFFMENGDFTLLSPDEEGGEDFTFGGSGLLSYLSRAVWRNYKYSVEWWPSDMDAPPDGAEGLLRVQAGRYRFFHMAIDSGEAGSPLEVVPGGAGPSFAFDTVAEFDSYFHDFRVYDWDFANGKGVGQLDLVHFMSGQPWAAAWMSPFQNEPPAQLILPGWTQGSDPIMLSNVGATPGAVLFRMIREAQHPDRPAHPIPLVSIDFTATLDSNGDAWATTDALAALTADPGENYMDTIAKLIGTGAIDIVMDPFFGLHAYNSYGRVLTGSSFGPGVVRFAKGVSIADRMRRELLDRQVATHAEVQSNINGGYQRAVAELPDASTRVTREIGVIADGTEDETQMEELGLASLTLTLQQSDAVIFSAVTGDDEDHGVYFPGPEGTDHGKYWPGDTVTVHTGSGESDYDEVAMRVAAVTVSQDEAGQLTSVPEVQSTVGADERRLLEKNGSPVRYSPRGLSEVAVGATPSGVGDIIAAAAPPSAAISAKFTFDSSTGNTDPGAGKLRLSDSAQSSSLAVRADNVDADGKTVTALLDLITAGWVRLVHATDPSKWLVFAVDSVENATGYRNIAVSDVQHSAASPFTNGDPVVLLADLGAGAEVTGAWVPVMALASNIVTTDGEAVYTVVTTADGDAVVGFVPI